MIQVSNLWKHPLTTLTGFLVSMACISPQIVEWSLGHSGNSWMLGAGIVSIIVGALAKDPGTNNQ